MAITEILKIEFEEERFRVPNKSGFYHDGLKAWFDNFRLSGYGLLIGDRIGVKPILKKRYSEIIESYSVELEKDSGDIEWDITQPFRISVGARMNFYSADKKNFPFDWIICQAVLEHVIDPVAAMKNLSNVLKPMGLLFLHVPGIGCPEHKFPIDCYRFFKDSLIAFQELAGLDMIDFYSKTGKDHFLALYRKRKEV